MKPAKQPRSMSPAVSEQMKAWSAALAGEVDTWPQASGRVFFGFTALYRGDKMFAALPRTRGMDTPNSLIFKLDSPTATVLAQLERDDRIHRFHGQKSRWLAFEISSDSDLRDALGWLGRAYDAAGKNKKAR